MSTMSAPILPPPSCPSGIHTPGEIEIVDPSDKNSHFLMVKGGPKVPFINEYAKSKGIEFIRYIQLSMANHRSKQRKFPERDALTKEYISSAMCAIPANTPLVGQVIDHANEIIKIHRANSIINVDEVNKPQRELDNPFEWTMVDRQIAYSTSTDGILEIGQKLIDYAENDIDDYPGDDSYSVLVRAESESIIYEVTAINDIISKLEPGPNMTVKDVISTLIERELGRP